MRKMDEGKGEVHGWRKKTRKTNEEKGEGPRWWKEIKERDEGKEWGKGQGKRVKERDERKQWGKGIRKRDEEKGWGKWKRKRDEGKSWRSERRGSVCDLFFLSPRVHIFLLPVCSTCGRGLPAWRIGYRVNDPRTRTDLWQQQGSHPNRTGGRTVWQFQDSVLRGVAINRLSWTTKISEAKIPRKVQHGTASNEIGTYKITMKKIHGMIIRKVCLSKIYTVYVRYTR